MSELRASCFGRNPERDGWPSVSVVLPIRNEAPYLADAVASVLAQHYEGPLDVCLAVAPSADGTEAIASKLADEDERIVVVANPAAITPAGLNAAIEATSGDVIVRVDGHAELSDGYIRSAVLTMCRTGAVNVGGMQVPSPQTAFEQAVAGATTSRMGTGGASYRVGGGAGEVDTVYLGVFDRRAGDLVGWFDETLIRNQDYELNIRLRATGGTVWFDPDLRVGYRPRGSWTALARQYFEYGWWKAEVLRRHPESLRLRQMIPPVAVIASVTGLIAAPRRRSALMLPAGYAAALAVATAGSRRRGMTSVALMTIHGCWSAGLLSGLASRRRAAR